MPLAVNLAACSVELVAKSQTFTRVQPPPLWRNGIAEVNPTLLNDQTTGFAWPEIAGPNTGNDAVALSPLALIDAIGLCD